MISKFLVVCLLSCAIARGQSFVSAKAAAEPGLDPNSAHTIAANTSLPQFDAASIKPAVARDQQINTIYAYPGGRIFCAHCTLQFLTSLAFDLRDWQITGGPEWGSLTSDTRYDLEATAKEGSQSPAETWNSKALITEYQRQMLKSLLMDRFQLKGHRETRSDTVYILQRGDQPLKLLPPLHPDESHWAGGAGGGALSGGTGIAGKNISMPELATRISGVLKGPVLDRTGLAGTFDFEYRRGDRAGNSDPADGVFASMQGIGLKLTPAKGPVEMLVIDHAARPSEN
jgi:uncharacterized protein (TIGR03435 family)